MKDQFQRNINYLRISVTDRCNFRCRYCMPPEGIQKLPHTEILSFDEIVSVVKICADLGIDKVRITGGEPFVRKNVLALIQKIAQVQGIRDIGITTNGSLLAPHMDALEKIGVKRLNFSLDSLKKERFEKMSRGGDFCSTMQNLKQAVNRDFAVKINCVLIPSFNDDEINDFIALTKEHDLEVRFIELMPIGPAAAFDAEVFEQSVTCFEDVAGNGLPKLFGDKKVKQLRSDGVAELFQVEGYRGRVGLIRPLSHSFCRSCNRIRLTADGKLKPCLHSANEIDLRGLSGRALREAIERAIFFKPAAHHLKESGSLSQRTMNRIGG
uniref:GTP 3',8-cyclase MoaA n=1 Tax=Ndongobacter massiliensis TaxID=1871025 RepID=UPI000931B2ED|nr:GTP 3',8-cyclase MoaA [Ndongobacter massiliensis]